MKKLQVVIPYLSCPWALEDWFDAAGELDLAEVLVIDNSPHSDVIHLGLEGRGVKVHYHPDNIGISASWNQGIREAQRNSLHHILISSQWVRMRPMEYGRRVEDSGLSHIARGVHKHANQYGLTFGDQGYHFICITQALVDKAGYFDENFLAYGEDDDYHHRLDLLNITLADWGDYRETGLYSIAFGALKRTPDIDRVFLRSRQGKMRDYYAHKWCSPGTDYPGDYLTPFGNPDHPVSYWPEVVRLPHE